MLLRKFEAYGFKSFAEKLELDFGPGITAIVGPNGSGKSNIADGIRWALGEQSVKNLRGAKMEDVIFAGSAKRRALGVAEVSLTFDNNDGLLPVDYREVIVTRRVFRSGESEYFINKNACRLKDVQDLLADTGLGKEAMAVIGQNKVDEILNSKPEERRLLFEEAAGITKYKLRKKEALRKLEDTSENLIRVKDIINEIEAQLEPMRESAARTKEYNALSTKLKACKVTILLDRLDRARAMYQCAQNELNKLGDDQINFQTKLSLAETCTEGLTLQLSELDGQLGTAEKNINEALTLMERIDGQCGVLKERFTQYSHSIAKYEDDLKDLADERQVNKAKIETLHLELTSKTQQQQEIDGVIKEHQGKYDELACSISATEQLIEEEKDQTFDRMQTLVTHRNELRTLERDKLNLAIRFKQHDQEREDAKNKLSANENLALSLDNEKDVLLRRIETNEATKKNLTQDMETVKTCVMLLGKDQLKVKDEYMHAVSRRKILSSMQKEYEGFGRGIKTILKSNLPWRSAICGAVAEIVKVPEQYITATEIALGGALQYLVTDNETAAKEAIAHLKQNHLGRATFLPLNTIRPLSARDYEKKASCEEGSLGIAAELIHCDEKFRKVIDFLLGRTIIVKDIDCALKIARNYDFKVKLVTLDGELVNPGGSLTGGSLHKRETGFLSRSSEIEQIHTRITVLADKLKGLEGEMQGKKNELSVLEQQVIVLDEERRETDIKIAENAVHRERVQKDAIAVKLALRTIVDEFDMLDQEGIHLDKKILDYQQKIMELEDDEVKQKNQVSDLKIKLRDFFTAKEELAATLTNSKIAHGTLLQEITHLKSDFVQNQSQQQQIETQTKKLNEERSKLQEEIIRINKELAELAMKRSELADKKNHCVILRDKFYVEKTEVLTELGRNEKEEKDIRRKLNFIQSRLHEVELMTAKYQYETDNLAEQLVKQHNVCEQEARGMVLSSPLSDIQAMLEGMEQQIQELGPINHQAIEEYQRVKDRYDFLTKQSDDLLSAKEYLNTIIKDIDKNMSAQFQQAFNEINKHFQTIFVRLFGGGNADLRLLEPSDILETGVDIVVQPPGKKLQNLALLSGGERALTVIALLFALLAYRPAPFCVLDEVDAALDEANVERFSSFLKEYARNTQFIIVTHRKGTMEVSDVMHGITMEEAGISKLLSVKFMENAG